MKNKTFTFHTHTNHWLIGVENANKSGTESAPPLKAVFKWADSVTFTGLPVNSNNKTDMSSNFFLNSLGILENIEYIFKKWMSIEKS